MTDNTTVPTHPGYYVDRLGNPWRLWNDGIFAMQADLTADPAEYGPWQRLVIDRPPVYLAADLWDALGAPTSELDAYLERNGWANTWSNLLGTVRDRFKPKCGAETEGERCVLTAGHLPPHYGPSDVGRSEPVPVPDPSCLVASLLPATDPHEADDARDSEEDHRGDREPQVAVRSTGEHQDSAEGDRDDRDCETDPPEHPSQAADSHRSTLAETRTAVEVAGRVEEPQSEPSDAQDESDWAGPSVHIQYKNTDICLDFQCLCDTEGEPSGGGHFDGYQAYALQCPRCGRIYEMPQDLPLKLVENSSFTPQTPHQDDAQ